MVVLNRKVDTELICKSCEQVILIPLNARSYINVKNSLEVCRIPISTVQYFKADTGYVKVEYGGTEVYIEDTLKSLEKEFSKLFMRIHKGILVATAYMEGFRVNRIGASRLTYMFVHLKGDVWLPTNKNYHPRIRQFFKEN